MSETTPVLCEHCGQPIGLSFGMWLHTRPDILAAKMFCSTSDTRATPPTNLKG